MSACRLCGNPTVHRHHVVHRRLVRSNDPLNLIEACPQCHQDIHDRKVDLLAALTLEEQGHAAGLIGISRAHRLLAPSVYRNHVGPTHQMTSDGRIMELPR